MLKRRVLVFLMAALMLALPVVAAAASHAEFEDGNLEAAVIEELANLGRAVEVTKIPQADMKLLKKLYAEGTYARFLDDADDKEVIRDLTGLEYALNLEALDLSRNFIKDLSPIANLNNLKFIDVRNNNQKLDGGVFTDGDPAFSYNPSHKQMGILQNIQHRGAVVKHDGQVKRISGPNRYETAVRIWQNMYTNRFIFEDDDSGWVVNYNPGNTIVLARGDDFADALVGAPLAYALGNRVDYVSTPAPILLTTSNKLHPATKSALADYIDKFEKELIRDFNGVFNVYVLGGTAAISDAVVNELIYAIGSEFDALDVRAIRVGGADRYATSVAVAKKLVALQNNNYINNPIIATGEYFPDALTAAPYAAAAGRPILLTNSNSLPGSVSDYLKDQGKETGATTLEVVIAGGSAAVSEKVFDQLLNLKYRKDGTDKKAFAKVTRVWGADRYATAVELGKHFGKITGDDIISVCNNGGNSSQSGDGGGLAICGMVDHSTCENLMYVATGEDFADALTGAPLAAMKNTGILLVNKNAIPNSVEKVMYVQTSTEHTAKLTILGGEAAVTLNNAVTMYNLVR